MWPPSRVPDKVLKLRFWDHSKFLGWDWVFPWPLPMRRWEDWASREEMRLDSGLRRRFQHNITGDGVHHPPWSVSCSRPALSPGPSYLFWFFKVNGLRDISLHFLLPRSPSSCPTVPAPLPEFPAGQVILSATQTCPLLPYIGCLPFSVLLSHSPPR